MIFSGCLDVHSFIALSFRRQTLKLMAKLFSAVHTHLDPFGVRDTPEGAVSEGYTAGDYVLLRVTGLCISTLIDLYLQCRNTFPVRAVTAPSSTVSGKTMRGR